MNDATHYGPMINTISSMVLDVRPSLLLETQLLFETRHVLEQCSQIPGLY